MQSSGPDNISSNITAAMGGDAHSKSGGHYMTELEKKQKFMSYSDRTKQLNEAEKAALYADLRSGRHNANQAKILMSRQRWPAYLSLGVVAYGVYYYWPQITGLFWESRDGSQAMHSQTRPTMFKMENQSQDLAARIHEVTPNKHYDP